MFSFSHSSFQSLHDIFKDFGFNKNGIALQSHEFCFQWENKIARHKKNHKEWQQWSQVRDLIVFN